MRVAVFGSGYVGLVTAACLAEAGNRVHCVDVDAARIERLKCGEIPIYEPGLEGLVRRNCEAGRLLFSLDAAAAIGFGDYLFIAVSTPPDATGATDLSQVLAVAESIGRHMCAPRLVIDKSTVPVGTADRVRQLIAARLRERGLAFEFSVLSNPEFLKEGAAIADFMRPDRIIVGTDSSAAAEAMRQLYAPFNRNRDRLMVMDVRSAELTKYAANAMLATKISFMNEMANLAERLGADIELVRQGIGADERIGTHFIYAGAGYGGSCFPKDVQALERTAIEHGFDAPLLAAVELTNRRQKRLLFDKIAAVCGDLAGRTIALWGLAFKPNTDDMREAPSRTLMELLWQAGATVRGYDPVAMDECRRIYGERPDLILCASAMEAATGADALAVVTEWREFRSPDFESLREALHAPLIFDGRNLFDPALMRRLAFRHYGIGRGEATLSQAAH